MKAALQRTIHVIKAVTLSVLFYSGLLRLLLVLRLRGRAVVLTYHRVIPAELRQGSFSADQIIVTPETFQRQMRLLQRYLRPLAPDEFAQAVASGSIPSRSCLVTFDDGWWDNAAHAAPILERTGVPAIVFVATDYIGSELCFWQERLARLLFTAWEQGLAGRAYLQELGYHSPSKDPARVRISIREFVTSVKSRPMREIEDLLSTVEQKLRDWGVTVSGLHGDRFMSWDEVKQMTRNGRIAIGSHCCSHVPLTKLDQDSIVRELDRSRREIAQRTGAMVHDLAYPNGDWNDAIVALVRGAGYRLAFTTDRGHVGANARPLSIRRINIQEQSARTPAAFLGRLAGIG
jgi:peptidoglycan/xylan/chitin deacetylase (PgdA/CDA1 family)